MQNPEQKINYKFWLIVFLGIASFIIAVWWFPILLFFGIWAISFVPKINKLLKKNWYSISDIFSKDGWMIISLILENLKKEKQKTQNNLDKKNDNIILDDETINELEINEIEQNDEIFNYNSNTSKALDKIWYKQIWNYNDTADVWKIIKRIIIGFVIIAALPIIISLPEMIDLFNIDIAKSKQVLESIFLSSSLISRIVLAIIALFIIFKISRDYYKNNKDNLKS